VIRFELAPDQHAALAFACSPLHEAVQSLHVLSAPKHHPLQNDWVRAMRRLGPEVKREIAALSFLFRWTQPNCILPLSTSGDEDFETELGRLRGLPADVAALELVRPVYDHGGAPPPWEEVRADAAIVARAVSSAGTLGPEARAAAELLFSDAAAFLDRFASLLERYWTTAFAEEWERIEPKLAEGVTAAGRTIAADGPYAFLVGLGPQLRVEPAAHAFGIDVPHDHRVVLGPDDPLLLMPSVYVWPHVRVNCDAPWPLALAYRAPHLLESMRHGETPEVVQLLRALADPTRLRILQLVAARPRSTQELAPLIALSEAGASKHLRVLAAAGLLTHRREGYYVVYSFERSRLDTLPNDIRHLID
jgi:DNA-binding transcriptional ArsR family regulator